MAGYKNAQGLPNIVGPIFSGANNDAAKYARCLLDTISVSKQISIALGELWEKHADKLPIYAADDLH